MKKTQPSESIPRKVGPLNKMAMGPALDTPLVNHRLRATARFCRAEVSKQFTLIWAARGRFHLDLSDLLQQPKWRAANDVRA
jgi:hypothetical protein